MSKEQGTYFQFQVKYTTEKSYKDFFKNGPTPASFFVYFRSFQIQFYSGIRTQIVAVEVEHADHLTTPHHYVKIPAQFNRKLRADYSRNSIEELIQRILASLLWGSITVRLTSCLNVQIQLLWLC